LKKFFQARNFCSVFVWVFYVGLSIQISAERIDNFKYRTKGFSMRQFNENFSDIPLCRFGPGGDFVSYWPKGSGESYPELHENKLTKIIERLNRIISGIIQNQPDVQVNFCGTEATILQKMQDERKIIAKPTIKKQAHTPTNPASLSDKKISGQQFLFADDWGAGERAGHKQKHDIRAHRGASKKRVSFKWHREGSLFGAELKSA
jgi:hypothetical protein